MMRVVSQLLVLGVAASLMGASAEADEAPIAGILKSVDVGAQTLTVNATARGRAREVVISVKSTTKIVRFVRPPEAGKAFVEQPVALGDLKPGWTVSVTTRHEGSREVAELIKIVFEP